MAIVLIHLSNEQELDRKMLKYTAATGPVYLRALEELAMLKEEVFFIFHGMFGKNKNGSKTLS